MADGSACSRDDFLHYCESRIGCVFYRVNSVYQSVVLKSVSSTAGRDLSMLSQSDNDPKER